ncbi:regulator of vps4 activity in the MVB pathway domain-containing protein [Ditylenchus destructor]|uniref:IST1 homolog n=1 Tax=Ditylenchus destructor TaxID=166010 RepID=A0AAD4NG90_9BILA|nr:regulator of vps4 activity in the MVB pathway domain-containing protein [Ditylenchus destructor]
MSVSWGTQYAKLKTNLRLAANRLRLLQKKKTEQAQKARGEIAEFLSSDKEDRARIRVESIIREDFVVEAYELLEMFCELLLARFGLIQQMKELDDGIAEAVSSILWVSPRIGHEVSEFKIINDQLTQKYGKQFAEAARMNQLPEPSRVSPKLIQKLSVSAPSKILVEKYLIEIARCANVPFTPDSKVMRDDDDEIATAERNLINFMNEDQIGWNMNNKPPNDSHTMPPPGGNAPGPNAGGHPGGFNFNHGTGGPGGGMTTSNFPPPQYAAPQPPQPGPPSISGSSMSDFNYAGYAHPKQNPNMELPPQNPPQPPPYADIPQPPYGYEMPKKIFPEDLGSGISHSFPKPNANTVNNSTVDDEHIYEVPPGSDDFVMPKFPEPPSDLPVINAQPPNSNQRHNPNASTKTDELNFDELARRFEDLKKRL